jgi:hypothetical protein
MSHIRKTGHFSFEGRPFLNFSFDLQGFDALNYEEHLDYELVQSTNPEFNKARHPIHISPTFSHYR